MKYSFLDCVTDYYGYFMLLLTLINGQQIRSMNPNCSLSCSSSEIQCANCACVAVKFYCDGILDCSDFSDEPHKCTYSGCKGGEYQCENNRCVPASTLCDGTDDCSDNSDESYCVKPVFHNWCFHPPFSTPGCYCKMGYKVGPHGLGCVDINECEVYGYCDQRCANTDGSFSCSCAYQYSLDANNRTCKAVGDKPMKLLVGTAQNITKMNADGTDKQHIVAGKIGDLDYDFGKNLLFWIDTEENKVLYANNFSVHGNTVHTRHAVQDTATLPKPCGLSYDWIAENLYVSDCLARKIALIHIPSGKERSIISDGIQNVKSLVVDPVSGYLFYADSGRKPNKLPRIVRAFMDGSAVIDLKLGKLGIPSGLTVDVVTRRFYWTDLKLDVMQTADYNGLRRQTIISGALNLPAAVSLTNFENMLYWADLTKMSVMAVSKFDQMVPSVLWQSEVKPLSVKVLHQVLQPVVARVGGNPCRRADCSQLCVLTHPLENNGRGYRCMCKANYQIHKDGRSCIVIEEFILFVTEHALRGIPLSGIGDHIVDAMIPKLGLPNSQKPYNFVAMDFDAKRGMIYYSDIYNSALLFQHLNGDPGIMLSHGIRSVEGMGFDWVTRLLYFTDFYYKTLSVVHVRANQPRVILEGLGSPRSVVVHPGRGYVYYADWLKSGDRIPFIGRCYGDGSHNIRVHQYELGWPNGMCIDFESDRLYWVDAYFDRLQHSDLDGDDVRTLQGLKMVHPFGVAVFQGHIYYTDWKLQTINRIDKSGRNHSVLLAGVEFLRGLKIYSQDVQKYPDSHPCLTRNGGCSDFCFLVPGENTTSGTRRCGCPFGKKLSGETTCVDNPSEVRKSECDSPLMFKCALGKCIPKHFRCDKENDCLDNSDEEGCDKDALCPADKFQCDNGKCLSFQWKCDGDNDCGDMSDEKNCPEKHCSQQEFRCNNSLCIHKRLVCDSNNNCRDGSDEGPFCANHTCHIGYFKCLDFKCIPERLLCDGDHDCWNGEDENDCPPLKCSESEFKCEGHRQCVPKQYRCDGAPDCLDLSDEKDCPQRPEGGCHPDEFKCVTGGCIPEKWHCDQQPDCFDQSDEVGCEGKTTVDKCTNDHAVFLCANDKCIYRAQVCDGRNDCGDGSDEDSRANCHLPVFSCPPGQWECPSKDRQCIDIKSVCDGIDDCPGGQDESPACDNNECEIDNGGCSFKCLQTPQGAVCVCPEGQKLNDTNICVDIDECQVPSSCSQKCVNVKGSYKCLCEEGYQMLPGNKHCAALRNETQPQLIVSNMDHFIIAGTDLWNTQELVHVPGAISLAGVDVHVETQKLYFSDSKLKKIRSMNMDGSNLNEVVSSSMNVVEDIAVDWIGGNLYWTDFSFQTVEVAKLNGSFRAILVSENVTKPRGIEVDPMERMLFWTDWGQNPKIERAGMCGCDRTTIISTNLYWPNGLSVDYPNKRLYFADARLDYMEFCDYDGGNRHKVIGSDHFLRHPHDLVVFEDFVLWTDRAANKVSRCNKFTCKDKDVIGLKMEKPLGIVVNHPVRQPHASNPCKDSPCSHLCLLSPRGFRCECPEGMVLWKDNCVPEKKSYLLYGYKDGVAAIDLPITSSDPPITPLSSSKTVIDIEFDSTNKTLFLIQGGPGVNDTVKRLQMFTPNEEPFLPTFFTGYPSSFALDWASGNLYWADPDHGTLNVMRLTDERHYYKVLLSNTGRSMDCVTPIAVVADPDNGLLYWADQGGQGSRAKIASITMAGSQRTVINQRRVDHPEYLARDTVTWDLYWSEGRKQQILKWDAQTKNVYVMVGYGHHPTGLVVHEDLLYFADGSLETINVISTLEPRSVAVVVKHNIEGVLPLKVYQERRLKTNREHCGVSNGGCQQLCLLNGRDDIRCECGTGYQKTAGGNSCTAFDSFLVVSQLQVIRGFSTTRNEHEEALLPIASPGKMASQLDVHVAKQYIYWCGSGSKDTEGAGIHRRGTDGAGYQKIISTGIGAKGIKGIAVDWIAGNLYFSNALRSETVIEVCHLDGLNRLVIVKDYDNSPTAMAVNPIRRFLYWIDGGQFPKIERANLDGTGRIAMVTTGIIQPRDITIDIVTHDVYWVDSATDAVQKINFLGGHRQYVLNNVPTPYGIVVFGDYIYLVDRNQQKLLRSSKVPGAENGPPTWLRSGLHSLTDIVLFSADQQPTNVTNPCSRNNSGCDQLCFAMPGTNIPKCSCSVGELASDRKKCQAPKEFLVFAAETEILSISLDTTIKASPIPAIKDLSGAVGIAVDYNDATVFFSQVGVKQLSKYTAQNASVYENLTEVNSNNSRNALSMPPTTAEGLAYDWINKRLYWSDASISSIVGMFANGTDKRILATVSSPRAVAVNPCRGFLFWTSWGVQPKVERSRLTGSNRIAIVDVDLGWPNGLGVDYVENVLYWVDALKDRIERSDFNGKNRETVVESTVHPFSVTVFGNFVYWTDWLLHGVYRAEKNTGADMKVMIEDISQRPMEITVYANRSKMCTQSPCDISNGGCSDKCSVTNDSSIQCGCSDTSLVIGNRGRMCIQANHTCQSDEFVCSNGQCLKYRWVCDGDEDCDNKDDENENFCAYYSCDASQFRCDNGRCIPAEYRCDHDNDCKDNSDEYICEYPKCGEDQFTCGNFRCIDKSLRCNGVDNCLDGVLFDEQLCPPRNCSEGQTKCPGNNICLDRRYLCDGENDCGNYEDENPLFCKNVTCKTDDFYCGKSHRCIPKLWVCDGEDDCGFGEDESLGCTKPDVCLAGHFRCDNGKCIWGLWVCDGVADCSDGTDEKKSLNCSSRLCHKDMYTCLPKNLSSTEPVCLPKVKVCDGIKDCFHGDDEKDCPTSKTCNTGEFACDNGNCIPSTLVCDHIDDCDDKSDEPSTCDYPTCSPGQFTCANKHCITLDWVCDREDNCGDNSDENQPQCANRTVECSEDSFLCTNGQCINSSRVCDKQNDCSDWSDEKACGVNECSIVEQNQCAHECTDRLSGYECTCRPGYRLMEDKKSCSDINECRETPAVCSQVCINTEGNYTCKCNSGYLKSATGRCKRVDNITPWLIFTNRYYIREISVDGENYQKVDDDYRNVVALDYLYDQNQLYFMDVKSKKMFRMFMNTTGKEEIIRHDLPLVEGLTLDWIGRKLYWLDAKLLAIFVSELNGTDRLSIIKGSFIKRPRAIVCNPFDGYLYWTDWGLSAYIGKIGMDGANATRLITDKLGWPNALTIDFETNRIWWADAHLDWIQFANADGTNRHTVRRSVPHPFAMTMFEDWVYWTDWNHLTIEKANKYTGQEYQVLLNSTHRPMDIHVYHPLRQKKGINPCGENNGGCSHLCLIAPGGKNYTCACPDSFVLDSNNNRSCTANCSLSEIRCGAVDDRCLSRQYLCDGSWDCKDGTDEPPDCPGSRCSPGQFRCRNHNCTYSFHVCDLEDNCGDGSDELYCEKHKCEAWEFRCSNHKCIPDGWKCDKADDCGDGSDEAPNLCGKRKCDADKFLCDNGRCIPNDWKCDFDDDCGDGSDEKEEWGCRNKTCKKGWWKCRSNYRCIPDYLRCNGKDDCRDNSDEKVENCPTCHPTGDYQCANKRCIPKRWLCDFENDCGDASDEDPTMCAPLYRNCSETEWRCKNQKCIRTKWICDYENDCLDNSDEDPSLCKANATKCSDKEFPCGSGLCIQEKYRCNGLRDCYDLADELDCKDKFTCPINMFQCNNKICIKQDWLCDGQDDCGDGSDETSEICHTVSCDDKRHFKCSNSKCIPKWWICNGNDQCGDGSDENNTTCAPSPPKNCSESFFTCKNGHCISPFLICNNIDDCGDASDEIDCFKRQGHTNCSVDNGGCEQTCTDLSEGSYYCSCGSGFKHSTSDHKACDDVDECMHWGNFCPQLCNNVKGSFKCQCADGFKDDKGQGTECKSEDVDKEIFFSTIHEIRRFVPRKKEYMGVVSQGTRITALDVNIRLKLLYWTDESERDLFRSSIPEVYGRYGIPEKLRIEASSPCGIAVDWVEGNVYWTDTRTKSISVVTSDGRYQKLLVQHIEEPLAIAVSPRRGLMYWADANFKNPKIKMAWMNGQQHQLLVSSRLRRPAALTVDNLMYDRVYWVDSKENVIESMKWDGTDRITVKGVYNPISIDVFENKMFWVSQMNGTGYYMNKFGKGNASIIQTGLLLPTAVRMFHYRRVDLNVKSRCPKKGSICSHLCLLVPGGFRCACPNNSTLIEGSQYICDAAIEEAKPIISACGCWNGGTCTSTNNGTTRCLCPQGYSGSLCEHVEPVKLEHDLKLSHSVTIVVPTVVVSVLIIGILVIIIILLKKRKNSKSSSATAVISYSPSGKVEITTSGQGHTEISEQDPVSDISGATQFANPIYETLQGEDPNKLNLDIDEETSFYGNVQKC